MDNKKKVCQICGCEEVRYNFIRPYELLNGTIIFTDKDCLSIPVLESFFEESELNDNINLELASKVLKDKLKRKKIRGEGMAPYYRRGR